MKILYIISRFTTGGAERLVLQYARFFQEQGHEVFVVSIVSGGELEQDFRQAGIKIFVNKKNGVFGLCKNYKKLKKLKQDFQPDIIHTHVFSADFVGFLLRKKVRWLSTQHNVGYEYSFLRRLVLRCILRRAEKVVAVSETVQKFCQSDLGLSSEKIKLVKNGIDLEDWLGIDNNLFKQDKLNLAIIGRIEKQKNHKYLFQTLSKIDFDWELNVYGVGVLEDELKKQAKKLGLEKKIIWHGVKNLKQELKKIDIVVQPSLWEGLSLVVMEVMTAGRLVITSKQAGEGLLENKKTGLVVDVNDKDNLVKALQWVYDNREESKKITEEARKFARNNFGIEENFEELKKVYQN